MMLLQGLGELLTNGRYSRIYSNQEKLMDKKISNELKNYVVNRKSIEGNQKLELTDNVIINSNLPKKIQ